MSTGKIPRNAPCPCGSGLKYKRCCLEDGGRLDLMGLAVTLAELFPLLRPCSVGFAAWLDAVGPFEGPCPIALVNDGIGAIDEVESECIFDVVERSLPEQLDNLNELLSEEEIGTLILAGAVRASLIEERSLDRRVLDLIETGDFANDPNEVLALALDGPTLWSVHEAASAEKALAAIPERLSDRRYEREWHRVIEAVARDAWTERHAQRLEILVARLRSQLPAVEFPAASALLEDACDRIGDTLALECDLGAKLLADTLGPLQHLTRLAA